MEHLGRLTIIMEGSQYQYRVVVLARFFGWIREMNAQVRLVGRMVYTNLEDKSGSRGSNDPSIDE